jgi:hypothetical protein
MKIIIQIRNTYFLKEYRNRNKLGYRKQIEQARGTYFLEST